ncbi:hypothetical protein ACJ41O_011318 [Fusarium nematophilum]
MRITHGPEAEFDVITRLDQSGQWHASVLKTEGGKRTRISSGTASDPVRAMEILHENSARIVDQFVACHGYDLPPSTGTGVGANMKPRTGLRGGDARPGVIALCGSSDSEASASDSDDSVDSTVRRIARRGHRSGGGGRMTAEAVNVRRPRSDAVDVDVVESVERRPSTWGHALPQRPVVSHNPPPGWNPPPQGPVPAARPQAAAATVVPPPPGRPVPVPPPGQRAHAALLNINWAGNGKKNMLVQTVPTVQFLQQIAISEAQMRPLSFATNETQSPYPPAIRSNTNYRATVRRVTLGDDTYEMTAFGNDLSALFRSTSAIPKFDIDITTTSIYPVFHPVVPPPRPVSAASSTSSRDIAD